MRVRVGWSTLVFFIVVSLSSNCTADQAGQATSGDSLQASPQVPAPAVRGTEKILGEDTVDISLDTLPEDYEKIVNRRFNDALKDHPYEPVRELRKIMLAGKLRWMMATEKPKSMSSVQVEYIREEDGSLSPLLMVNPWLWASPHFSVEFAWPTMVHETVHVLQFYMTHDVPIRDPEDASDPTPEQMQTLFEIESEAELIACKFVMDQKLPITRPTQRAYKQGGVMEMRKALAETRCLFGNATSRDCELFRVQALLPPRFNRFNY